MAQIDPRVDPRQAYEQRRMSAEQAAGLVESGDLAVLATRESELRGVRIRSIAFPHMGWFRPDAREAWDLRRRLGLRGRRLLGRGEQRVARAHGDRGGEPARDLGYFAELTVPGTVALARRGAA